MLFSYRPPIIKINLNVNIIPQFGRPECLLYKSRRRSTCRGGPTPSFFIVHNKKRRFLAEEGAARKMADLRKYAKIIA
jgi:hypothetical protein